MSLDAVLLDIQDKLPEDVITLSLLRENFENLSDSKKQEAIAYISTLNFQSPAVVFWVGSFLFGSYGVGRFMLGDKALGFARLGISLLTLVFTLFAIVSLDADYGGEDVMREYVSGILYASFFYGLSIVFSVVSAVWWFMDLFLVGKKVRRQNFEKIMRVLNYL